ncbi:putative signal peptide peptidase [Microlunatus phosphovorus NM-1]|uniref:Putative signal peptide peptidase n=1 Tax=Microlunatus phosphovorus (strain ATCC 700054 / DSM 10555 / JCM 9379 / NBRC 101784 / NCIMB 13414 / VKM Ac-1990 / NM-1) TaxID=1032480 RepID=F5XIZ9_MICPN|nr:putative signal peptide peptidase [Microlunatus phosphovorus NM-1]
MAPAPIDLDQRRSDDRPQHPNSQHRRFHRSSIILELDLTQPLVEPDPADPLAPLLSRGQRQLRPTIKALHEAAADHRVVGLLAKVGGPLSWATVHELRRGLQAFLDVGKPTVAWAESFPDGAAGTGAYVLASGFGEVWLQPGGGLGLLGVSIETTFLRGAFDKLGMEPQLGQRYEYKNAADRFTRTEFTEPHRESMEALAASVYADAIALIAAGRSMTPERVRELVDTGPRTAEEALAARLVDRLGYRDEVLASFRAHVGDDAELLFADRWKPRRRLRLPARRRGHLALVEVRGGIGSGRSRPGPIGGQTGSDTVASQLRAALEDDRAHGVLLRVNSPGGSAVASEVIWREVCRVKEAGKPVVVSMGDVAASGGYYVSCAATTIVALPTTLTGSIGVLGGKFVISGLLDRLGLSTGAVHEGEHARMWSARRGFDDGERERLDAELDAIYAAFVAKVAAGRGRTVAEIEPLARGRVWTGRDAYDRGLVDQLGGLREAVTTARRLAELPADAPLVPAVHLPVIARLSQPRNSDDPRALVREVVPSAAELKALTELDTGGIQLRMPEIRLR